MVDAGWINDGECPKVALLGSRRNFSIAAV
jgi:hypothetical protein